MKWEKNSYALVTNIWLQSLECNFSVQAESYLLSFLLMQKFTLDNTLINKSKQTGLFRKGF